VHDVYVVVVAAAAAAVVPKFTRALKNLLMCGTGPRVGVEVFLSCHRNTVASCHDGCRYIILYVQIYVFVDCCGLCMDI
jgi:hypothetical protein